MKQKMGIVGLIVLVGLCMGGCGDDDVQPSDGYTAPPAIVGQSKTLDVPGNYRSIQEAVNAASTGDFIRVGAGNYTESIRVNDKALSLRGAGIGVTILQGSVVIENSSEASFEGFTIRGGGLLARYSQARITGNEIRHSPGVGLQLERCPASTISGNTIMLSAKEGIVADESGGVIGGNIVRENGGDGIVVNNASPTLLGNEVIENRRDGISIRSFMNYASPLLLANEVEDNGVTGNYDIICFGDKTNPTGMGNEFDDCINCAECRSFDNDMTYQN